MNEEVLVKVNIYLDANLNEIKIVPTILDYHKKISIMKFCIMTPQRNSSPEKYVVC